MFFFFSRAAPYESRGAAEKKRVDDYAPPKRDDYKRDDYNKRESFKRPIADYPKRGDIDPPRGGGSSGYDSRSAPVHRGEPTSSKDRYGMPSTDSRPSNSFGGNSRGSASGGRDDRDPR